MLGAEAVTWGVLQGVVFLSCKLSEDSCQLSKLWSSIWLCHWNSVWFRHLWGTPVFCALLVKEEVSKKKEVLTTVQVFIEAWAFTRMPGQCYRFCTLCSHPVTQCSFHICVLEQGRACTECTHQLLYEKIPYSCGWLGMLPKGCQAVFQTCQVSSLVLSWFSCQGLAPCWGWMARNVVKGSLMGSLKGLSHGRKRQEFTYCHWWVSFSRGNLCGLYLVFPSSQTWSPLFKQRTFLQQVLAEREKCAGENKIPVQEETVLLERQLSGLLAHTHFIYNIPRSSLQIAHYNVLWRNAHVLSTCLVWEKPPAILLVVELRR